MNIVEVIHAKYPDMTKKQKALADYMLAQPDSMSFMTLKALAAQAQVSEMTILHYCTALGFANYNDLKYAFRQYQSERAKITVHGDGQYNAADLPANLLTDKRSLLAQICQEEFDLVKQLFAELDLSALFRAAGMALDCQLVVLCARGVSLQIADFLSNRLTNLGLPSVVVNTELNDAVQAALPLLTPTALLVAVSLPDYYFMTSKLCEYARLQGTPVLIFTDSTLQSPAAAQSSLVLSAPCASRLFLSSPAPMLLLANLFSAALEMEKSDRHASRRRTSLEFSRFFADAANDPAGKLG